MAHPRDISAQSGPLMSQDLEPSTAVGFQQQGTVDWTSVLSGGVTFSIDVLSRLSKAGVETFTIYAARAIFSNLKIGPNGEVRLHCALDKLSAFPSFGKALWFGFGVRHIVWSMQESAEGLSCLGICACLTEGYSTIVSAKILRELFLLYDPPAEFTPALRQWLALIKSSAGLFASSEFGLVLHGLTRFCLREGHHNLRASGSPKDIALVLKQVFEVSNGLLDRLFLIAGPDCAWIAAVAHWLLDLRVEVRDEDGTIIYRPDGTRSNSSPDAQIIVTYHQGHSSEKLQVIRKHYVIAGGKMLFTYSPYVDIMSLGRVPWQSCLVDTFGSPMRLLLGQAWTIGACLGSAARIFSAFLRDGEGHKRIPRTFGWRNYPLPVSESSYGKGFCLLAHRLLPELGDNPVLYEAMQATVDKGFLDAVQQFSRSLTSLRQVCSCMKCRPEKINGDSTFCLLKLVLTICTLVRVMSTICMQEDLEVQPTRSGLESLYWTYRGTPFPSENLDYDPLVHDVLALWPEDTLVLAETLFAARGHERAPSNNRIIAISHSGLCFYLNTLTEITSDPQRACLVTIIPGTIEWNNFAYDIVRDQEIEPITTPEMTGYDATSVATVTNYDNLADSSTPGLRTELIVEEVLPESNSLSAIYRVSTSAHRGQHFSIRAGEIWHKLGNAFTAASCEGMTCESPNGIKSILVKGEGFLRPESDWTATRLSFTRVLSAHHISVWIALSQNCLPKNLTTKPIRIYNRLQGKQCVRCCIVDAESVQSRSERGDCCWVSIITSVQ